MPEETDQEKEVQDDAVRYSATEAMVSRKLEDVPAAESAGHHGLSSSRTNESKIETGLFEFFYIAYMILNNYGKLKWKDNNVQLTKYAETSIQGPDEETNVGVQCLIPLKTKYIFEGSGGIIE